MCFRALTAVSLSAFSCVLPLNAAQAAMVDARASLSGLTFSLIDLAPDDGIAPSLTFTSNSKVSLVAVAGGEYNVESQLLSSNPFQAPSAQVSLGGGVSTASHSPELMTASVTVSASDFQNLGPGHLYAAQVAENHGTAVIDGLPFPDFAEGDSSFTLSPQTALVIQGNAKLQYAADASDFTANQILNSLTSINVIMAFHTPADPFGGAPPFLGYVTGDQLTFDRFHPHYSETDADVMEKRLLIGVSNVDPSELALSLDLYTNVTVEFHTGPIDVVDPVPVDPVDPIDPPDPIGGGGVITPPIPEPGTWALMGLGLAGVGLVTRRRHPRA